MMETLLQVLALMTVLALLFKIKYSRQDAGRTVPHAEDEDRDDTALPHRDTGSYSVFHKNHRCGLVYERQGKKKIFVLDPKYTAIRVDYAGQDIETLFSAQKKAIRDNGVRCIRENGFQAVTADGRCGLMRKGDLFTGLAFKNIVKLSFRHYLCINENRFRIIFFHDFFYETADDSSFYFQGKPVFYQPPLGMTKVVDLLSRNNTAEAQALLELIEPDGRGKFLSRFNHFSAFIDDIDFEWAIQRKIIHDDFSMEDLDMRLGAIAV